MMMEVIRYIAESNRSLQEKAQQGSDRFHEYNVPNIQMTIEKIELLEEAH